jgi:CubicO group peptidase (beta-lactamase class C family)
LGDINVVKTISPIFPVIVAIFIAGCSTASRHRDFSVGPATNLAANDPFAVALEERMPALLATNHVPGAVVSYITNGAVAWTKAFGVADLRRGTPMRPDMVFNLGSLGKVLTAWGVMRLLEAGRLDLNVSANRYLKRWQIRSQRWNPDAVTIRRLLSHTAGLTLPGLSDYPEGARLPSLVEVLEGKNQDDGPVIIGREPGSTNVYSGGGFVVLQTLIEDVTGEPFAEFMRREIATPLGLSSLEWVWTAELERHAPTPYGWRQEKIGYRQLASQAVGSEICSVADYARFLAATVSGPGGEPVGRGVLKPETVAAMLKVQPNSEDRGLGYRVVTAGGEHFLEHGGHNPGWRAKFLFDVERRNEFVVANNSSSGITLNDAVGDLWGAILSKEIEREHR